MGGNFWGESGRSQTQSAARNLAAEQAAQAAAAAAAEAKKVADAKAAADAKIAQDIADKKAWDLKIGKTRKKSAGGSARTDYHTGLGEAQQADIAGKTLLGM